MRFVDAAAALAGCAALLLRPPADTFAILAAAVFQGLSAAEHWQLVLDAIWSVAAMHALGVDVSAADVSGLFARLAEMQPELRAGPASQVRYLLAPVSYVGPFLNGLLATGSTLQKWQTRCTLPAEDYLAVDSVSI